MDALSLEICLVAVEIKNRKGNVTIITTLYITILTVSRNAIREANIL